MGHGVWPLRPATVVLSALATLGLVMVGVAAGSASRPSAAVMVEGTVRSTASGRFDLLVEDGPYCPSGTLCPMFLTRPKLYVVTDGAVRVYSWSGAPEPTTDIRPGVEVVVSGTSTGHLQIAATGVLLIGAASGPCGWPDPYGPPCPAPSPLGAP